MIDLSEARSFPKNPFSTSPIPVKKPGIYAMYDHNNLLSLGKDVPTNPDYTKNVAYVGSSRNLKERIRDHIIRRNSSVVTGVSAAVLNPDKVSHICWWCHQDFSDKNRLGAAEIVAFEVFNPSLRSLAPVAKAAQGVLKDGDFCRIMKQVFKGKPDGLYYPMTFDNLVYWTQNIEGEVPSLG